MSKDVDEIKALYDAPQKKEVFAECKRMTKAELAAHVVASNTKIQELEAELASLKSVEPEDTAKDLSKILDVGGTEERMRLSSTDESLMSSNKPQKAPSLAKAPVWWSEQEVEEGRI